MALALGALMPMSACGGSEPEPQPAPSDPQSRMLGETVSGIANLSTLAGALEAADFTDALDRGMPFTLLAPTNAAFSALGPGWAKLSQPGNEAKMRDFLREHLIPGYMTPREIDAAIARNGGKPITLRSAGTGSVTFSREDGSMVLKSADGVTARIVGEPVRSRNGAALPIDTVLAKLPE